MFSCRAGFDRIFAQKSKTEIYRHFAISPFRVLNTPVGMHEVPLHEATFLPGSVETDLFGHGIPSSRILALRIESCQMCCREMAEAHFDT